MTKLRKHDIVRWWDHIFVVLTEPYETVLVESHTRFVGLNEAGEVRDVYALTRMLRAT